MNVMVTGGAGYIGSVMTEMLLDRGHRVAVFDSLERGHREAVDPRADLIVGDLKDADDIRFAMRKVKPEAVLHFAAYALVGESMEDPLLYYRNNVKGGLHLVEAMRDAEVEKIIFSSTCATYGMPTEIPITERHAQNPINPYGDSKLQFEHILNWCRERLGMKAVYLRYFNACGASGRYGEDHDPETHLIPNILRVPLGKRDKVMIFGDDYDTPDGTCIRDYIHILDLAEAHMLALQGDHAGAFNLGNGDGYSVKEVIDAAREVTGHDIPAEVAPRRPGDPDRLVGSAARAREVLGWNPRYADLKTIVRHAWEWHRTHPNGYAAA
jgi:UDP-glucose 4-epimerase